MSKIFKSLEKCEWRPFRQEIKASKSPSEVGGFCLGRTGATSPARRKNSKGQLLRTGFLIAEVFPGGEAATTHLMPEQHGLAEAGISKNHGSVQMQAYAFPGRRGPAQLFLRLILTKVKPLVFHPGKATKIPWAVAVPVPQGPPASSRAGCL